MASRVTADLPIIHPQSAASANWSEVNSTGPIHCGVRSNPGECCGKTDFLEADFRGVCWWEGDFATGIRERSYSAERRTVPLSERPRA